MNGWDFLAPFSLGYGAATSVRNWLFDTGLCKVKRFPVPVISVGNLTAGGTGKTPVTIALVKELQALYPDGVMAVVSRGYGRSSKGVKVVADTRHVVLDATRGGDEPVLIARRLPGTPVIVAEKRATGVKLAHALFKPRVVVLDDAFQHRMVARDLDVVLLDPSIPKWHWRWLPSGRLRESPNGLERAGLIVLRDRVGPERSRALMRWLRRYTQAPVLQGMLAPMDLRELGDGVNGETATIPLLSLLGQRVVMGSGIASPGRFERTLEELGADVVGRIDWSDHATVTEIRVEGLLELARNREAQRVVITEKDAVKWPSSHRRCDPPVTVLRMQWAWTRGEDLLKRALVTLQV